MKKLSHLAVALVRFFVVWFVDAVSLLITARVVSGITIQPVGNMPDFVVATAAAFVLGIVNFLIRPLLLIIAMPLGWVAVFVSGFFINGIVLWLTSELMSGFDVSSFSAAFWGGLFLSLVNTVITTILAIDDEDSFYENLVQRHAARQAKKVSKEDGRGLVILETDGLSYQRIQKAIADGMMPTLKQMMDEEGYRLSRVDCGLPPTTPACQAGILQGNNTNIPAFRWLDKKTGRLLAGGGAAAEVEPILSDGNGLLRGGTSIGNMFSGDAAKSILTFSKIFTGTPEDKKQRAQDMFLLMRNPYFFTRVLVLYFADVALELWQGWRQRRKKVWPRLNRLHNGYPFLRSAVNVFLRDIGTYFTILDIIRGAPAIYTLYAGYDEIAHHSGPYTQDTDITLRQFDKQVARLKRVIEEKAPRPFEILILSDHGQSFGPTFKQRYGVSILDFIQQHLPQEVSLAGSGGGDDGTIGVAAMMDELENMKQEQTGGRVSQAMISGAQRLIKSNLDQHVAFQETKPAKATLAYGGNGAMVYFDLFPRKVTLNELNAAYPGMVDKLVQHEGIGFVVAYDDELDPILFGKSGARNLRTGDVTGEDPLLPFGQAELRAWQLKRMADFENSGDLILNSTLYPDGTVAALEELIGNHGGLGGEQTDAYLFHPGDMVVPDTRGSYEFKAILDSRRGLPGTAPKPARPAAPQINPWSFSAFGQGLAQVGRWLGLALSSITLNRDAYREIANDALMTAPALLIVLLAQVIQTLNSQSEGMIVDILARFGLWWLAVVAMQLAARFLRGKATFTTTLRVAGFAQSAHILGLLGFLPIIGPVARLLALAVTFFGVWIGVATAQNLRGLRTLLLPVVFILVVVVSVFFARAILLGASLAIPELLAQFGWTPAP
jgi:uncharacterized membrane protein YvlD (DUF360 family)